MLILARTFLLFPSAIKQFVEDYRNIPGGQDLGTILQRISDFNDLIHRKLLIYRIPGISYGCQDSRRKYVYSLKRK